ncbi:XdhC family protein [Hydrogenophaga pseudoflava]|jgi:xanthine dehydrogenase accessory factor|uniref:XdhC family protein n=1 Tax=Hydrogenophaga pseudoflava TaxID=47421 RepID=UPI0008245339|nr:XdhC family protein [Hydrogenophaga pseudoflava]
MENLDITVLRHLLQWRQQGQRALLATVIRTWGSSPRPVGSIMALCETGAVIGSVSGGCIEDDLIYRYRRADGAAGAGTHDIPDGPPERVKYGVSADEAHRFGLPCGGTLELMLEFNPDADALATLVTALGEGRLMQRSTDLATGRVTVAPCERPEALSDDGQVLRNTFGPEYRMLLIGAGQLAEYLSTMAIFCGFSVSVCDPREEYRSSWNVPGAKLLTGMPDDVVHAFGVDRRTCVIALTHDPKLDDLALLEALGTEAFYVGAIGSRRNNEARRARMIEHFDQTEESLVAMRGPIGIYIGSKMPSEIAVSIMAEVLAVKNGVALPRDAQVGPAKDQLQPRSADEGGAVCFSASRVA